MPFVLLDSIFWILGVTMKPISEEEHQVENEWITANPQFAQSKSEKLLNELVALMDELNYKHRNGSVRTPIELATIRALYNEFMRS